jgi:predicted small metal-binding protein
MYTLACKDLGSECDFVANGETQDAVLLVMMGHASTAHAAEMAKMTEGKTPEDIKAMLTGKMKEEQA